MPGFNREDQKSNLCFIAAFTDRCISWTKVTSYLVSNTSKSVNLNNIYTSWVNVQKILGILIHCNWHEWHNYLHLIKSLSLIRWNNVSWNIYSSLLAFNNLFLVMNVFILCGLVFYFRSLYCSAIYLPVLPPPNHCVCVPCGLPYPDCHKCICHTKHCFHNNHYWDRQLQSAQSVN